MVDQIAGVTPASTDIVAVIFIGIIAVSMLITLFFVIKIFYSRYIRNSVRFNIIMPDGKINKTRLKNVDKAVKIDGIRYLFDDKAILMFKNTKDIFYFYKHPQPIIYDRKLISPNSMSSLDVANIIDEEYSAKLFKSDGLAAKDWIVLAAVGVAVIISLYTAYTMSQGVSLSPETIEAIKGGLRGVLNGG